MEYNYGHNDSNKVYVNGKPVPMTQEQQQAFSDQAFINDVMIRAFMYMFIAVLLTAVVAMYTATSGLYRVVFANPALLILIIVAEFAFVIAGNRQAARNSKVGSAVCLFGYSIVNGLTLSTIFLAYNLQFITFVFLVTSLMFGITAVIGAVTKKSLASWGSYLLMGLIGLILVMIVNIFVKSSGLDLLLSVVGVLIFVGLTAYDTQKIKVMAAMNTGYEMSVLGLWGALSLYLDFINLFLYLLRFFGNRN